MEKRTIGSKGNSSDFFFKGKMKGINMGSVVQLYATLCDSMDYSSPGSSVNEIFQARTLEWVAISYLRGSSRPRDLTQVSCIAGVFFTN